MTESSSARGQSGSSSLNPTRSERAARMALSCVVDGGDPLVGDAVEGLGAQSTWVKLTEGAFGDPLVRRSTSVEIDRLERWALKSCVRFVIPGDEEWPEPIGDLRFAQAVQRRGGVPFGLWLRGPLHLAHSMERSVAIVGSRASTSYGNNVATDLGADLAEQGVAVVSGGAFGIDAAAHRGALAVGGPTVCVLACGVDVPYPRGNATLFDWLAQDQLLVSELPPGATPTRVRFLARNRLIAALSQGTVVVEAALRSGARNTASWALECQRQLMAVPGPVHSAMSAAPHLMIRNGQAALVSTAAEVLELISPMGQNTVAMPRGAERPTDVLDAARLAVFEAVSAHRRSSVGNIALKAGVSVPVCLSELAALEGQRMVEGDERGWRLHQSQQRGLF